MRIVLQRSGWIAIAAGVIALASGATAQSATSTPTAASADKPAFKSEELDQMLAPIALYPDSLLSQILMASTYPLEIVEADRWAKSHENEKGDAAAKALEQEKWDPSVKSLVNFPDVLSMLSDKLDWTQKLGDAFLGQQKDVMAAVQRLRAKAKEAGMLETTNNQKVTTEQTGSTTVIQIEPANPNVVYVPVYSPYWYGTWAYPAYPPYPYYPPAYGVGVGIAVGFAWGYAWGHCDWNHSSVNINVNQHTNINTNIDRSNYTSMNGTWNHAASHRQNVPYRNQATAQSFGGRSASQAAQSRESYRGRDSFGDSGFSTASSSFDRGGGSGGRDSGFGSSGFGDSGWSHSDRSNAWSGMGGGGFDANRSSSRGWGSMGGRGGGGRFRR